MSHRATSRMPAGAHGRADAERLFERLLALRNDVGLLAKDYDPYHRRLTGNPQASTHVSLVNTTHNLSRREGPAEHRARAQPA
jgi:hypothetical protein